MKEIYEKVSANLGFVEREKATRAFWEKNEAEIRRNLFVDLFHFYMLLLEI